MMKLSDGEKKGLQQTGKNYVSAGVALLTMNVRKKKGKSYYCERGSEREQRGM